MAWLDWIWNLKFVKGYRTKIAQIALFALSAYQGIATSQGLIDAGIDLPNINAAVFVSLTSYFSLKVAQFANEH
jgi:hypothetical protein